jgi:antitoxin PrlF
MEISTVTQKGQATIPAEIRKLLGIRTGDKVLFKKDKKGRVHIERYEAPDWAYLRGVEKILAEEWLSPEDCAAYDDL